MTRKDFKKCVTSTAKTMLLKHGLMYRDIVINTSFPYISIEKLSDCYFYGDDAQQLIDEIPDDINPRSWILFYLNSAGIL